MSWNKESERKQIDLVGGRLVGLVGQDLRMVLLRIGAFREGGGDP